MKTLFVVLAALLFAFFLGCQSSITDPVVPETTKITGNVEEENIAYKDAVRLWPGVIKLEGSICEPIHNTCNTTLIGGVIRYNIKPIRTGHQWKTLKVGVYVNAEFKHNFSEANGSWRVYGMTEDIVYLLTSNQEVYTLEKEFLVTNTGDYRIKLVVRFEVKEKALKLISLELKKSADILIGDPEL